MTKNKLYEVCEKACQYFEEQAQTENGANKMLVFGESKGIKAIGIHYFSVGLSEWRLGYAPESWDGLIKHLKRQGFSIDLIVKAGLTINKSDNKSEKIYDRFRNRIIFPVFDIQGRE